MPFAVIEKLAQLRSGPIVCRFLTFLQPEQKTSRCIPTQPVLASVFVIYGNSNIFDFELKSDKFHREINHTRCAAIIQSH